jgi:hypothetical protein
MGPRARIPGAPHGSMRRDGNSSGNSARERVSLLPRVRAGWRRTAALRADPRRALEPDLSRRHGRAQRGAEEAATRPRAADRARHAAGAPRACGARGQRRARPAPDRAMRRRIGQRLPVLRDGVPARRRAAKRAARRLPRCSRRPRAREPRARRDLGCAAQRRRGGRRPLRLRPARRIPRAAAAALAQPVGGQPHRAAARDRRAARATRARCPRTPTRRSYTATSASEISRSTPATRAA